MTVVADVPVSAFDSDPGVVESWADACLSLYAWTRHASLQCLASLRIILTLPQFGHFTSWIHRFMCDLPVIPEWWNRSHEIPRPPRLAVALVILIGSGLCPFLTVTGVTARNQITPLRLRKEVVSFLSQYVMFATTQHDIRPIELPAVCTCSLDVVFHWRTNPQQKAVHHTVNEAFDLELGCTPFATGNVRPLYRIFKYKLALIPRTETIVQKRR